MKIIPIKKDGKMVDKDNGGVWAHVNQIKFLINFDFEDKINELIKNQKRTSVTICTYSIGFNLLQKLDRLSNFCKVEILFNTLTNADIDMLREKYPTITFIGRNNVHAKFMFIGPDEVLLSSKNIWNNDPTEWFQWGADIIGDEDVYNYYLNEYKSYLNNSPTNRLTQNKQVKDDPSHRKAKGIYLQSKCLTINYARVKLCQVPNYATELVGYVQHKGCNSRSLCIVTYTMPDNKYKNKVYSHLRSILNYLDKGKADVSIFVGCQNLQVINKLQSFSKRYSKFKFYTCPNVHAKLIINDNNGVILSSQNFSDSGWFEDSLIVKNKAVHNFYLTEFLQFIENKQIQEYRNGIVINLPQDKKMQLINDLNIRQNNSNY